MLVGKCRGLLSFDSTLIVASFISRARFFDVAKTLTMKAFEGIPVNIRSQGSVTAFFAIGS